jgi:serine/threonine-protein kinase
MPAPDHVARRRNPYLNRVMIRNASDFYGRRREVAKIFARIGAARPQSVAIVGERRIGKSSLLHHLCHPEIRRQHLDDPDSYVFVLIDLQEQREIGIRAFFESLFSGVEQALGRTRPPSVPADYEGARRALLQLQEEGRKIILLFDEFDAITRNPNFPEEFFAFLRAVANKYDVAYVTTSGQDLQKLCHAERIADSPFFNIFSNLFLTTFEREEATGLIREPSEAAGVPLAPYTTDILDMSGFFPFFIQVACSAFFEQLADGRGLDRTRVRASFLEESEPHFNYICGHLDDDQRRVLKDIAEGRPVPQSHSYLVGKLKRDGYLIEDGGRDRLFSSVFASCIKEGRLTHEPAAGQAVERVSAAQRSLGAAALDGATTAAGVNPGGRLEGQQIGAYQILSLIGAGGMGEVYRARDSKLGRDVAIKILPRSFAADPERVRRFEREARLLAALDHANIGAIYGFEQADGLHALVLALVEGPTLGERLVERRRDGTTLSASAGQRPGLSLREVLTISRQIALALESAHKRDIIHRDLKPANIKIDPEGVVKVLDFGLAKELGNQAPADLSILPTREIDGSLPGVIVGTAAYMSPEQARGRRVDTRTDVWAFGCVLYEMLSGCRAFGGETLSDTIARILEREPDWQALPRDTPPRIQDLLRRCLQKDVERRLPAIKDARIEIEQAQTALGRPALWSAIERWWRGTAVWLVSGW